MSEVAPQLEAGQPVLLEQLPLRARGVIDVRQDNRLVVAAIDGTEFPAAFEAGYGLNVVVPAQRGLYEVPATVNDRGEYTLMLDLAEDGRLVQRRAYVRIEEAIHATCLLLHEAENTFVPFDASVNDVSGGGCAMHASVIAPKDAVVVCSFAIPDERPVVVIGSVLPNEREDRERLGDDAAKLRVMFTNITERDRDRLIRFILRAAVTQQRP